MSNGLVRSSAKRLGETIDAWCAEAASRLDPRERSGLGQFMLP